MAKKITMEDLAGMIKLGFDETAKQDEVDKRFDEVDKRLVGIESDVSYLKARLHEVQRILDEHGELLEEHSEELRWIHKKIDEFTHPKSEKRMITYHEFSRLESRLAALEKKVTAKI